MGWDGSDWYSFFVIAGTFIAGLVCLCIGCFFIYYFFIRPFIDRTQSRPGSSLHGRTGAPPPPHQYYYTPGSGVQAGYNNGGVPVPTDPAKYSQYAQQQYGVNGGTVMTGGPQPPPTQTPVFAQTPSAVQQQQQQQQQLQQQQEQSQRTSWQQQSFAADAQSRQTPMSMHGYGDAPPVYSHQYQLPPDSTGSQGALNVSASAYNSGPQSQQYQTEEIDPTTGAAVRTTYRTTTTVTRNTAVASYAAGSSV